jgi:Uma2 family endonuclease
MKAVMPSVPPFILEWRRQTGADRFDEMWEGVLHMAPTPNFTHQEMEGALETFLRLRWARPRKAEVIHKLRLASPRGWPNNYRIPDLMLLTPERFSVNKNEYFEGAPNVVVEIKSPDDESEEKLPFYLILGVPEVWMIDRDTKEPTILALEEGSYQKVPPGADGWILSRETGIELRQGKDGKLEIRLQGDDSTREELP